MSRISPTTQDDIRAALRDTMPVTFAIVPFAALFGALAREAGFSIGAVMAAAGSIYAGASQYVMLDLLGRSAPAWSIILAVFVLNFRHVLYSAALGRHMDSFGPVGRYVALFFLVDPLYASAEKRRRDAGLRVAYYAVSTVALYCVWLVSNLAGALFGGLLDDPATYGLDFILPLYFVSLVISFRASTNFLPVLLASAVASLVVWATLGGTWPILIGGGVGLVVAAIMAKPKDDGAPDDAVAGEVV